MTYFKIWSLLHRTKTVQLYSKWVDDGPREANIYFESRSHDWWWRVAFWWILVNLFFFLFSRRRPLALFCILIRRNKWECVGNLHESRRISSSGFAGSYSYFHFVYMMMFYPFVSQSVRLCSHLGIFRALLWVVHYLIHSLVLMLSRSQIEKGVLPNSKESSIGFAPSHYITKKIERSYRTLNQTHKVDDIDYVSQSPRRYFSNTPL